MKKTFTYILLISALTSICFAQWAEQTSGVTTPLRSVSAVDQNIVWACGNAGRVVRTTNAGLLWTPVTNPIAADLYNIFAIDANTALTTNSAASTQVWRTTNGGVNWSQVFIQAGGFINAIWMTTPLTGFMQGDPVGGRWSLWRTLNGGVTWDSTGLYLPQNAAEAGWNNGMYVSGNYIWFNTNGTRVYYSSNSGLSWTAQAIAAQPFGTIWFNTLATGMCGTGATLQYTNNSGTTWAPVTSPLPGTGNVYGIAGTLSNWWVVRAAGGQIYRSTDNGGSWTTDYTAPTGTYNHLTRSISGFRLWAVRSNGAVAMSEGLVGIIPIGGEVPQQFRLSQNYPNPFNPATNIKFSVPKSGLVKIAVYDAIGRETAVLVNENLSTGNYSVEFNASNFSSGIYFYTILAGDFKETKKMMLIK